MENPEAGDSREAGSPSSPSPRSSAEPVRGFIDLESAVWPSTEWPAGPVGPPSTDQAADGPDPSARRRPDRWTVLFGLFGGVLLGTGVTLAVLGLLGLLPQVLQTTTTTVVALNPPSTFALSPPLVDSPGGAGSEPSAIAVAVAAVPSVVAVDVAGAFGLGGGSGVVISGEGHIVTNHHVIDSADEVAVEFPDGVLYQATVVGSDPLTDIALIATERPDVTPMPLGTASNLVIGERTIAVGNPLGLEGGPSVTTGIVSATQRTLQVSAGTRLYGLLQTDAPITRGSSGGALLDSQGRLLGITTAIAVSDVGAEGLGFAVPVETVAGVVEDLINDGEVRHALLGIEGRTVMEQQGPAQVPVGVGVSTLSESSGFSDAGGELDDVIIELGSSTIRTLDGLLADLRQRRAGDEVAVRVVRDGEAVELAVTLGELG